MAAQAGPERWGAPQFPELFAVAHDLIDQHSEVLIMRICTLRYPKVYDESGLECGGALLDGKERTARVRRLVEHRAYQVSFLRRPSGRVTQQGLPHGRPGQEGP
ncbi:hypothetical protein GCM10009680_86690 [Streptomyces yatensis]|uniref:Uncharacterized protein n=1 Tax=Streptomyces yatensis TaxID=155177 RepID=A0ABN2JMY6_9ACTN